MPGMTGTRIECCQGIAFFNYGEGTMEYCKLCDKPAKVIVEQIESSVLEMLSLIHI